jgi:hypothetical protein
MSWSVSGGGTVEEVVGMLQRQEEMLTGQGKTEFAAVRPFLEGLVKENFNKREGAPPATVQLDASGHGSANGETGEQYDRQVQVTLRRT